MSKYPVEKLEGKLSIKHGFPFEGEFFSQDGDYIVLTPGNFLEEGGFYRDKRKDKYYNNALPEGYLLAKNDLIVAMTEQAAGLLGSCAFVPEDNKYLHNQRLGLISCNEESIRKDFLYYLFQTPNVRKQITGSSSGTKVKHTSPERIYDVLAPIPNVCDQERIGETLSLLDAKIELNSQINSELKAMTKLIYDYWFVQFDFPDANGKPYKSSGGKMIYNTDLKRQIPQGWEVVELGDLVNFQKGISYSSKDVGLPGIPMINLDSFYLDGSYKKEGIKYFNGKVNPDRLCKKGDLVIAVTDVTRNAEIIGKGFSIPDIFFGDILISTDVAKVELSGRLTQEFTSQLFNSESYHNYIKHFATGTLVLHLDLNGIRWSKIALPPLELQKKYSEISRSAKLKFTTSMSEDQTLNELRDWLLPMLMNGQVTVSELSN